MYVCKKSKVSVFLLVFAFELSSTHTFTQFSAPPSKGQTGTSTRTSGTSSWPTASTKVSPLKLLEPLELVECSPVDAADTLSHSSLILLHLLLFSFLLFLHLLLLYSLTPFFLLLLLIAYVLLVIYHFLLLLSLIGLSTLHLFISSSSSISLSPLHPPHFPFFSFSTSPNPTTNSQALSSACSATTRAAACIGCELWGRDTTWT